MDYLRKLKIIKMAALFSIVWNTAGCMGARPLHQNLTVAEAHVLTPRLSLHKELGDHARIAASVQRHQASSPEALTLWGAEEPTAEGDTRRGAEYFWYKHIQVTGNEHSMDSEVTADTTVFSGEAEHDYVNVGLYIAPFGRGKFYAESGFQLRAERSRFYAVEINPGELPRDFNLSHNRVGVGFMGELTWQIAQNLQAQTYVEGAPGLFSKVHSRQMGWNISYRLGGRLGLSFGQYSFRQADKSDISRVTIRTSGSQLGLHWHL